MSRSYEKYHDFLQSDEIRASTAADRNHCFFRETDRNIIKIDKNYSLSAIKSENYFQLISSFLARKCVYIYFNAGRHDTILLKRHLPARCELSKTARYLFFDIRFRFQRLDLELDHSRVAVPFIVLTCPHKLLLNAQSFPLFHN